MWKGKRSRRAKVTLENTTLGVIPLVSFKTHSQAIVMRTVALVRSLPSGRAEVEGHEGSEVPVPGDFK